MIRVLSLLIFVFGLYGSDVNWPQFRGPNGSGVAETSGLPIRLGPSENLLWRTPLDPGYSSPVLTEEHVFITAYEGTSLQTICLDRESGRVLWRRATPKALDKKHEGVNTPVSPTPATDGTNVYSFFDAFGLVSYSGDGAERWRLPLGPFNTPYGMGTSPVLAGDTLLLLCDQDTDSFLLAVDKNSGKVRWRTERPEATHGFSSPVMYEPSGGPKQILASGSHQLISYSLETGERLWWVHGMSWQAKALPVVDGDDIYVNSWMATLAEMGNDPVVPPYEQMLALHDADKDGRLSKEETPDKEIVKYWFLSDLDKDGYLTERDWKVHAARGQSRSGLFAIRPRGSGDLTGSAILWQHTKSLPNIASPLLYQGVLYVLKDGGILTAFDPVSGKVLKQGRVKGAVDLYLASPVAADGKIFTASKEGKVAVLRPGRNWEVLAVNDLKEECWATPAIAGGRLYIRTQEALYCFGSGE